MGRFFERLVDEGLYNEWALLLDWLFDDYRFSNWSSGYVGSLTKKIKRLPYLGKESYIYDIAKNIQFPDNMNHICIMMTKGDSESKDLIRHIRNGIAHGKSKVYKKDQELYIEICDYTTKGMQSAYIFIPLEYIGQIHKLYLDVKKAKEHSK